MCGIAGFVDPKRGRSREELIRIAADMAANLIHRGPDAAGAEAFAETGLAFGFRRLSIQDLSVKGAQPMHSASGRYTIVFNGEVYNFRELRQGLEGAGWRGGSDTEVMLAAIEQHGIEAALPRFDGMFAFALYDHVERRLHLVRDRMGEKPLYYGWSGGCFIFGSELKALAAHREWHAVLDEAAAAAFMRYAYVPGPYSIYRDIRKLPPGHRLDLSLGDMGVGDTTAPIPYWSAREIAADAWRRPDAAGSDDEAAEQLENLLARSVERRLVADVPLGVFLSGGIDSSAVAALAQEVSATPVRTFTIGFEEVRLDESNESAAVADHLGTDHTTLMAGPDAVLDLVHRIPDIWDEPFADVSQLPTLLLAELTRAHVTVALSGDGGDELFAGYPRYVSAARRHQVGASPATWIGGRAPTGLLRALAAAGGRAARIGDRLARRTEDLGARTAEHVYEAHVSRWRAVETPLPSPRIGYYADPGLWPEGGEAIDRMMYADSQSYLPDDLLVKIDRATMAVGLEGRAPMLDHEVVAFAWAQPPERKLRNGISKWLLRQVLHRYVPAELVDRPKQGFEPPLGDWLRGPLRDWAEALLSPEALPSDGLLARRPIRRAWAEHQAGRRDWRFELWNVLMFQAWRAAWRV